MRSNTHHFLLEPALALEANSGGLTSAPGFQQHCYIHISTAGYELCTVTRKTEFNDASLEEGCLSERRHLPLINPPYTSNLLSSPSSSLSPSSSRFFYPHLSFDCSTLASGRQTLIGTNLDLLLLCGRNEVIAWVLL